MRLIRLEDCTLYKLGRTIADDGDTVDSYEKIDDYKVEVEYVDNDVTVSNYGYYENYSPKIDKVLRVASTYNQLEKYLLPKINNKEDNLSDYVIEWKEEKYRILKVTPKYIEMTWR